MIDVLVWGSANADLVLNVGHIPRRGETVLAVGTQRGPGGKGVNQAVAAARSGATTVFCGAVGADTDGAMLRAVLTEAGVDLRALRTVDAPTGLAVVTVSADGENSIVVAPGANATLISMTPDDEAAICGTRVLLAQLETPVAGLVRAARLAQANDVLVVVNAAPSQPLPAELWANLDVLVVNEHEAADLLGDPNVARDPDQALAGLLERAPQVVLTLGSLGSRYADRSGARASVLAPRVESRDTTAAGDTFCGVLAGGLSSGHPVPDVMRRATAAAALCVQRAGAAPSIPAADQIDAFQGEVFGA